MYNYSLCHSNIFLMIIWSLACGCCYQNYSLFVILFCGFSKLRYCHFAIFLLFWISNVFSLLQNLSTCLLHLLCYLINKSSWHGSAHVSVKWKIFGGFTFFLFVWWVDLVWMGLMFIFVLAWVDWSKLKTMICEYC